MSSVFTHLLLLALKLKTVHYSTARLVGPSLTAEEPFQASHTHTSGPVSSPEKVAAGGERGRELGREREQELCKEASCFILPLDPPRN
jgi:hypothetical protein